MAANYSRRDFDAVRSQERSRLRELEAIAAQFNRDGDWVRQAWEDGVEPQAARDQLSAQASRQQDRENAVRPHPDGIVVGRPAVELLIREFFARPDVARGVDLGTVPRAVNRGPSRDALARCAGIEGPDADPATLWLRVARERSGWNTSDARVELQFAGGSAGVRPASGLVAAVRDSLDRILTHDWQRSGAFWMAATMLLDCPDHRRRRWWIASAGTQVNEEAVEGGGPAPMNPLGGGPGWRHATVQVDNSRRQWLSLSLERLISAGGVELSTWAATQIAIWHDDLDRQTAALLEDGAVRTLAGGFDDLHLSAATAALNRQTLGSIPLGSSRPVMLAGEARRGIMAAVPGPAHAEGDQSALFSRIEYSASVPEDFCALIHQDFMPVALGYKGELEPQMAVGRVAGTPEGVSPMGGQRDSMAIIYQHRSDPALLLDGAGKATGVVRLVSP